MVLENLGHICYYFSGQSNRPAERSRVVPEASFTHPAIAAIGKAAFDDHWDEEVLGPRDSEAEHFHHKASQDRVLSPAADAPHP